jgi:hypothetical protein
MGSKAEFEFFTGKGLIEDGHYDRMGAQRKDAAGKSKTLSEIKKQLVESSLETPVKLRDTRGDMLVIKHQNMRNKTLVVGTTVFIFDENSIARVPRLARADFEALLRQPGYSAPYVQPATAAVVKAEPPAPVKAPAKKVEVKAPAKKTETKTVAKKATKKVTKQASSKKLSKSTPTKSAKKRSGK